MTKGPFLSSMGVMALLLAHACGSDDGPGAAPGDGAVPDASTAVPEASSEDDATPDQATAEAGPLPDRLVIADGVEAPSGIAVDDEWVYYADRDAGTIVKCPHRGCGADAVVLVAEQDSPIALSHDGIHLYWVTGWRMGETGGPASRPVFRCALPDCATIEPFDRGSVQPYGITVVAGRVYLAAWPTLAACSTDGCSEGDTVTLGSGPFVSVDVDDEFLYGARFGQGQVDRCPLTGCPNGPAFLGGVLPMSVVVDDERMYVADYDFFRWRTTAGGEISEPQILSCPVDDCSPANVVVVDSGAISPYALAEHGDRLFFTNIEHGSVVSLRK